MKKVLALILALVLVLSLVACGGSSGGENDGSEEKTKSQAVTNVEKLINDIGAVTAKSGDAITKAEKEYSYLTSDEQKQVSNYGVLQRAKDDYSDALTAFFIGDWEYSFLAETDYTAYYNKGDTLLSIMTIYEGGSLELYSVNKSRNNNSMGLKDRQTWSIEDGLLKRRFTSEGNESIISYRIDFDNETLTDVEKTTIVFHKVK